MPKEIRWTVREEHALRMSRGCNIQLRLFCLFSGGSISEHSSIQIGNFGFYFFIFRKGMLKDLTIYSDENIFLNIFYFILVLNILFNEK